MFHKLSMHINIPQRIENIAINMAIIKRNHLSMFQRECFRKVNEFIKIINRKKVQNENI